MNNDPRRDNFDYNELSAQWGNAETTAPSGIATPYPEETRSKRSPVGWLIAIILVVLIAIIAVLAYLFITSTSSSEKVEQAQTADSALTDAADGSGETLSGGLLGGATTEQSLATEDTDEVTAEPESVEVATPLSSAKPSSQSLTDIRIRESESVDSSIPGATSYGWADNASVSCRANEDLIFAGRGDNAWVTVCESGDGHMTYRSDIFGGNLTAAVTGADPTAGQFTVEAAPSVISLNKSQLIVYQNGATVTSAVLTDVRVLS